MSVTLRNISEEGIPLEATFLPLKGMNLISYKKGAIEVLDQSTRPLFAERFAGLGALIGPHFHHRSPESILPIPFEERFPHIERVRAKGIKEPISHGIARYAPWSYQASKSTIKAELSGSDTWEGVLLSSFEGFHFKMTIDVELRPDGLFIEFAIVAKEPSVVGFHYYYAIDPLSSYITVDCKTSYFNGKALEEVKSAWKKDTSISIALSEPLDYGFYPSEALAKTPIYLHNKDYLLCVSYQSHTEESSFQLFHPEGSSYVCIEPLSASFPKQPTLFSSGVSQLLQILYA